MEKKETKHYFLAIKGKEVLKGYGITKMPKKGTQFALEVVKVNKDTIFLNLVEN